MEAGQQMSFTLRSKDFEDSTFFAIRATDERQRYGDLSNVVEVTKTGLTGGAIAGIVIGCILAGFVVFVVGFLVKRKIAQRAA